MRRLHSLLGVWIVVYLTEHLLVNSQAALFFEDNGFGFISMVNQIHALPYLKIVELVFLGVPFFIHGAWGVYYALSGKLNAHRSDGNKPALPQYRRNHAYSWQRITSWLLLFAIIAHVVHMRFIAYPVVVQQGEKYLYLVRLNYDSGLPFVSEKIDAKLYDKSQIDGVRQRLSSDEARLVEREKKPHPDAEYIPHDTYYPLLDRVNEERRWLEAAEKKPLGPDQILASAPNAGSAFLLIVREAFKSPLIVVLYSIFVVAAVFHAFNGLWTVMITWGITLTRNSQKRMRFVTTVLMGIVMFLGLMAAWGTYWTIH